MSHRSTYKLKTLEILGDQKLDLLKQAAIELDYRYESLFKSLNIRINTYDVKIEIDKDGCVKASGYEIHRVKDKINSLCMKANVLWVKSRLQRQGFLVQGEKIVDGKIEIMAARM
jgi:hypothetical protein